MITIVDYGLGNILAFANMYKRLNISAKVARDSQELEGATKLILPGVGAFDHAMELLEASGMRQSLDELVVGRCVPVLGICVGMQILAASSHEGCAPGLNWIDGRVMKCQSAGGNDDLRLPHMGWNDVSPTHSSALFAGLEEDARFYFLHTYFFHCNSQNDVLAKTQYGSTFASAVGSKNVHGVQFHPEKSHHYGARLLKNFSEI